MPAARRSAQALSQCAKSSLPPPAGIDGPAPDAGTDAALAGNAADAAAAPAPFRREAGDIDPFVPVPATLTLPADKGRILACEHVASVTIAALSANSVLTALGGTGRNAATGERSRLRSQRRGANTWRSSP
jgi:hypothetical protein